jgi:hypothetical protein
MIWLQTRVELLTNPYEVFGDLDRANARQLLEQGRYGAAARAWQELANKTGRHADRWRAALSTGLDQADRINLRGAAETLCELHRTIHRDRRHDGLLAADPLASEVSLSWLPARAVGLEAVLEIDGSADPTRQTEQLLKPGFLDFIEMMIRLAERRDQDGEHDLGSLFAYRALEAIPQRRLARLGFEVDRFDWAELYRRAGATDDRARAALVARLFPKTDITPDHGLRPTVDRGVGLSVLAFGLRDPLVPEAELQKLIGLGKARNASILAHGIRQIQPKDSQSLLRETRALFSRLLELEGLSSVERAALTHRHSPPPAL